MKKLIFIALTAASTSTFADPGIMIEIDIILERPTGKGQVEMGDRLCS